MARGMYPAAGHVLRGGIVEALNSEWDRLDRDDRGVVAMWAVRYPVLNGCCSFGDVLDAVRTTPDAALGALLAEVVNGEQRAGRVVLQSMIGRVVRLAQRDEQAGIDEYIAALWCVIATYPLVRRPERIAANLGLDTLKVVQRECRWVVRGQVTTWPPSELLEELFDRAVRRASGGAVPEVPEAEAADILRVARELRLIDDDTTNILTSIYVEGLSGSEAARQHGTSAGSIRVRCSRAVGRLSGSVRVLREAA